MQTGHGSSSNSSGGGGGPSRAGLARFLSAPATWLETLLEDEEEDPLKPTQCLAPLLADNSASPSSSNSVPFTSSADPFALEAGFLLQNSSPANFIDSFSTTVSEECLSSFGIPASYNSVSPNINVSSSGSKRTRETEVPQNFPSKLPSQVKQEQGGFNSSDVISEEMDKILEESVPCRVRAKRGCATHPRSIAERVRRTRISDRIRKLQELLPNMDKHTNTADMLEAAVAYVKHLQGQIGELTELQRTCACSAKE